MARPRQRRPRPLSRDQRTHGVAISRPSHRCDARTPAATVVREPRNRQVRSPQGVLPRLGPCRPPPRHSTPAEGGKDSSWKCSLMRSALTHLRLDRLVVFYPGNRPYDLDDRVHVEPFATLADTTATEAVLRRRLGMVIPSAGPPSQLTQRASAGRSASPRSA